MKKSRMFSLLLVTVLLCGCGRGMETEDSLHRMVYEKESSEVLEIEQSAVSESNPAAEESRTGDGVDAFAKKIGFGFTKEEYDYAFYVRDIILSDEGDSIIIEPIEFVYSFEEERWEEYHGADSPGHYSIVEESGEEIEIKLTDETQIAFYNFDEDDYIYENADIYGKWECVTQDLELFQYCLLTRFTNLEEGQYPNYPFFLILDENGNAKYIIEPFWT